MKFVYIAGPYSAKSDDWRSYFEIDANIRAAEEVAAELANAGVGFFCPHTHSAHFEVFARGTYAKFWYELDMRFLEACDAILMLPRWIDSVGSKAEYEQAIKLRMPIFFSPAEAIAWSAEAIAWSKVAQ